MPTVRTISLHPRLAAVLEGLVALFFVWWLGSITTFVGLLVWFGVRLVWWMILIYATHFPGFVNRLEHFEAVVLFNLGAVFLLIFVDVPEIRYLFEAIMVAGTFFSFWLVPMHKNDLSLMAKPYRRFKFLMSIFGVAGSWTAVKALDIFQIFSHNAVLWLGILAVLVTVVVSIWGWREYALAYSRKLLVAAILVGFMTAQMAYIIFLWPLGYFASGFLITWMWYLIWLMLRFCLTEEGVVWRKQRAFLLMNGLVLAIFLTFITRWK